ncbi:MAG: hypothetical protein Q4C70_06795 [Planctomycetia bacterium]|nr:hypothetical protein [Planctomycetia bacterium]
MEEWLNSLPDIQRYVLILTLRNRFYNQNYEKFFIGEIPGVKNILRYFNNPNNQEAPDW